MKKKFSAKEIERIINNSWNYEAIRIYAINVFNRTNTTHGISEKYIVIYKPTRLLFFDTTNELGIEKYLDCELLNEESTKDQALIYRRCFAFAFQFLYNSKRLLK